MDDIVITETEDEYLLRIPQEQKERAKSIEPRPKRWDRDRVRWVYSRNMRTYNALISEFGDDLTSSSTFSPPEVLPAISSSPSTVEQNEPGISEISEDIKDLRRDLWDIEKLRKLLSERDKTIAEKDREIGDLRTQVEHFTEKTNDNHEEVSPTTDRYEAVKEIALECLGNDPVFDDQVEKLSIGSTLPVEVAKIIENHLKQVLSSENSFYELLEECKDSEMLEQDILDIAHIIRKQRNVVAHHDLSEDKRTRMARAIFCLFGAVFLLPKLPEH